MNNNDKKKYPKESNQSDKREKITESDFIDYQRTKENSIRNKILEAYKEFSDSVSDFFYYKTNSRRKFSNLDCFVNFDKEDYEQYGFLGLLDAIDSYNPFGKCSFKTYAHLKIIWRIENELRKPCFFSSHSKRKKDKTPLMFSLDAIKKTKEYRDSLKNIMLKDSVSCIINNRFKKRDYQIFIDYELKGYTLKQAGEKAGVKESRACQIHSHMMNEIKKRVTDNNLDFLDYID